MPAPVILMIRDGWGINPGGPPAREENGDATLLARTPFHDRLYRDYPRSHLSASGVDVGLPAGQMGNSEVGHLNLGAGRVVYQDLTRINKAIAEGDLARNEVAQQAFSGARGHRLHLLGLISDGGVHSHLSHVVALAAAAKAAGVTDMMVHAFTDGRDASPTSGADFLTTCSGQLETSGAYIATVVGRYFAMDRDRRWDRTEKAWDAIVCGRGEVCDQPPGQAVRAHYARGETDEFMPPLIFADAGEQRVRDGDTVLFCNFRADRARQLSQAFLLHNFEGFDRKVHPRVNYITLTQYDVTYPSPSIFSPEELTQIFGEVVSAAGKKQLRRRSRASVFRRGPKNCAVAESCHLRFAAGDERRAGHGRSAGAACKLRPDHPEFCESRYGRSYRCRRCRHQGGRNDRQMRRSSRARASLSGREVSDHRRPRQLRANAQRGWFTEHRAYDQFRAFDLCRERRGAIHSPRRHSGGRRANLVVSAEPPATGGNDWP
jgi:BPG-independent PGAM N-terminus (iPGM_N)/Metalloenzyme superfamily